MGVLALQGDFEMHRRVFAELDVATVCVRQADELNACQALVIPGGESTTLARLIDRNGLRQPLRDFAATKPVLGTCAGLILLARDLAPEPGGDHGIRPLGLLDCEIQRNGYGRQVDSFSANIAAEPLLDSSPTFLGVFIRAPRILTFGQDVEVVATHEGEPVGIRQQHVLGLAFHPELAGDGRIHKAFLRGLER
jgi:5'-phosphate synthase pdxT subunit